VAYAITRAYGPAVHRNRLRRRLRAILRDLDRTDELPPVMLLIGPRPRSIELTFDQIRQDLTSLVQEIRSQHRAPEYSV
jgi:ribonuclease P protein component